MTRLTRAMLAWGVVFTAAAVAHAQCVGAWYQITTSGPSAREYPAMAYDPVRQQVVLNGGYTPNGGAGGVLSDTWVWDGLSWSQLATNTPGPHYAHSMAFDEARGTAILFGGSRLDWTGSTVMLDDTWAWDGSTWTRLASGAPLRQLTAAVFDPHRQQVIAFSGNAGGLPLPTDTWAFGTTWNQVVSFGLPSTHAFVGCGDPVRGVAIAVGRNQTFEWDGQFWTQTNGFSPYLDYPAIAFNRSRDRVVMFGGSTANGMSGDTWEYNGATHLWTQVDASGPSPRYLSNMVYDEARQALVLYGGYDNVNIADLGQTWIRTAAPVPTATPAPQRVCPSGSAVFTVAVSGDGPFLYRWQVLVGATWAGLIEGGNDIEDPAATIWVHGSSTPSLTVRRDFLADHPVAGGAMLRCRVANACGQIVTNPVRFITCIADFNCSGSLTVQDVFDYLTAWVNGDHAADVNGGGLSVQDIFDYLNAWFVGCP